MSINLECIGSNMLEIDCTKKNWQDIIDLSFAGNLTSKNIIILEERV